jgi:glycerol-3-phosphate dehydrogenase (NAD(P)+)
MRISLLGAGAWGTALACSAARSHDVVLWGRDPVHVAQVRKARQNGRYLPGLVFPPMLQVTEHLESALSHALDAGSEGLCVLATPMSGLRQMLQSLPPKLSALWLCKGFEAQSGALGHEIAREIRPHAPTGILSGPSFALEVALGKPTALVAASDDPSLLDKAVSAFHGETLRVYRSTDVVGVEVGGAVKNVLAIATGLLDGLASASGAGEAGVSTTLVADQGSVPGLNARAALITRGLAEMTRLGVALGAQPTTFMGLSGLGDLVLTATGALSRNRQVGLGLAAGQSLADVLDELGHVAEGVYSAHTVLQRARGLGVDMPITQAVAAVLQQQLTPQQAMAQLMAREATAEL